MGEARTTMDRMTDAMIGQDLDEMASLYAVDAVVVTPETGEMKGREQVIEYLKGFMDAFPDARFELVAGHEAGNVAIDEGYLAGTNSGPLTMPSGEVLPATGRSMRLRTCDVATVEHGLIVNHRFYYDQVEFMSQLGLLPDAAG